MSDAVEAATEVVDEALNSPLLDELDAHIQLLTGALKRTKRVYGLGGLVVGAAVGGGAAFYILRGRLETKYAEIAETEIADARAFYTAKVVAAEPKPSPEEIIEREGYSAEAPMAVTPPENVVAAAEAAKEETDGPDKPKPPVAAAPAKAAPTPQQEAEVEASISRNVFDEQHGFVWDVHKERAARTPNKPYVIHYDERLEDTAYPEVTWTYYAGDDVLCNEKDEVMDKEKVGEENLDRFGQGSNDPDVVYVRNNPLHMDIEICRSDNSYVEEVVGIKHNDEGRRRRRERSSPDDE